MRFVSVKSVLFFNATLVLDFFLFFSERGVKLSLPKTNPSARAVSTAAVGGFAILKVILPVKRASYYFFINRS